ncbi:MAG TPA: hypothetical protein VL402_00135 [Xanthobacteraceae bacterium]|jgi:hypothetical protein|nr:hypothetical protein [Xanthobacteraceae bacterium]
MFRVKADTKSGAFSIAQPTAREALETAREWQDEGRENVVVLSAEGKELSIEDLEQLASA